VTDWLVDPAGGLTYSITRFSNGSPDIQPENARTNTVGVVYQPRWLKGLSFSTDWYSVDIKDNITQMSANAVADGCYLDGDQKLCALITRSGDPIPSNPAYNYITLVGQPYINQDSVKAVGMDFEVGYHTSIHLFGGGESAGLRLLGTYLGERTNTNAGVTTHYEGTFGLPDWIIMLSGNYNRGPLGISMQARYTSDQLINRNWNYNGTSKRWDVLDNTVDAEILVNARVNYRFETDGGDLNLYANVSNLFNKDPQQYLAGAFSSWFGGGTGLGVTGDLRGRRFVVGLSYEFE
jgi:outer membrane receptor for ferrienterochelin and colicin